MFATLALSSGAFAQITVSGSTGANGTFTSLTNASGAFAAINGTAQTGNNIVITVTADVTTEAGTNSLNNGAWTTLTISPSGARTLSGTVAGAPMINLNGAKNVAIDGLNTGGNSLTISNLSTAATAGTSTIRFIADATGNTIQNCTIAGSSTLATTGTIFFSTGTTTGNTGNTITNNNITPAGANLPFNAVYSLGTSAAIPNTVTVSNNNISDTADNAATAAVGIFVAGTGNTGWTITGNRIFQTASRAGASKTDTGISIQTGNGYTVSNNVIGFANSSGTGAWTVTGTVAYRFIGIDLSVLNTTATSVQGNTIAGFSTSTSSGAATANGIWCGINVGGGTVNVGTTTGNTIGATTGTGSITTTTSTTAGLTVGINDSSANTVNISNNNIGSVTANGSTTSISASVTGIQVTAGTPTISGNLIGSSSTANSINSPTVATTGSQLMRGIDVSSGVAVNMSITNNTVANTNAAGTTSTGSTRGISYAGSGMATITGNSVHDLSSANSNVSLSGGAAGVQGILYTGTTTGALVSQNTVFTILATNATAVQSAALGIGYSNPTGGVISKNKVYDIRNASTMTTATTPPIAAGIMVRAAPDFIEVSNNMISLGTSQTTNTEFIGIFSSFATIATVRGYYNSVSIAGTVTSGALPSFCFLRGDNSGTAVTTPMDVRDNIFSNTRSGGTGKHYAIANQSTTASATGWGTNASNFNVLNGTAATIGLWGSTDETFANWKTASASDASSLTAATFTFTAPATGDLHLASTTTALNVGTSLNTQSGLPTGTWTVPTGVSSITVTCIGAGGGSGGSVANSSDNGAGGGGGGASANGTLTVSAGQTYTVAVGGGGNAGAATGTSGGTGGTSSFTGTGGTVTALGGGGGGGVTTASGSSGIGTAGTGAAAGTGGFAGGNGTTGLATASSEVGGAGGGGAGSTGAGGNGTQTSASAPTTGGTGGTGSPAGGSGAGATNTTGTSAGVAGNTPGGGAAGAATFNTAAAGAAGGTGAVTITTVLSTDFDGDTRNSSTPYLGADEIVAAAGPTLTAAAGATVDSSFNVTFTDNPTWRGAITSITVGGTTLSPTAYSVTAGQITFTPANSTLLQSSGTKSIVVIATGFSNDTVSQAIAAGAATKLSISTQPTAPAANGGALATQPVVLIQDQYSNTTTSTATVVASAVQGTWTLGGTNSVAAVSGTVAYSGLTATSSAAVSGATISFTSGSLTGATSNSFNIPAPSPPTVTASAATAIASTSATLNGNITATGGSNSTVRGFEYSTTNNFANGTGTQVTESGSFGTGAYSLNVSGLSTGTTYYVHAFATNGGGTSYSSQLSFTTFFSGSYDVGTGAPVYTTLKSFFDAVNAGTVAGNITVNVVGNCSETASAVLNQWTESPASSNFTMTIQPSGGAARTISGTIAGPLIDLNGADRVTIDGLNVGGNALTISNASTSALTNTSTIRFIADATNNTVTNCTIAGSGTSTTFGTVFFSTGTTTGNVGDTISNNTLGAAGSNLPTNAIYSAGTSTTVVNTASITGNNIQDYFNAAAASNGILVASNSAAWTITGNKFFQSATRTATTGSLHSPIQIVTASGGGYTINNNTIGFAAAAGTGTTTYAGAVASRFSGIDVTAAATPASDIQGNTIAGISFTSTSTATTAGSGVWQGITVRSGTVNVGTTAGNTIGAASGTGSLNITSGTLGYIAGIYATSANPVTISNNTIGAISTGGSASIGYTFVGVDLAGAGSHTVTSNTIGNATANNIAIGTSGTTTAATTVIGVRSAATGTTVSVGNTTGTGNTIQNMSSFGSSTSSLWYGIQNTGAVGTLNTNFNTFAANTLAGGGVTAATFYYANVVNSGAVTTAQNANNNTVTSGTVSTATFAGSSAFIVSNAGGASSTASIQNNTFSGLVFTGATGSTGSFYGIYHTVAASIASKTISNNAFNNLTLKTSGQVILIFPDDITPNVTVSGNSIGTQFTRSVSSTINLYGIFSANATGASSGTHIVSNNNLSNITSTTTSAATTGVVGIVWQPGVSSTSAPTVSITGNTISNHTNSSTAPAAGIIADFTTNLTISNNTVSDLSTAGATSTGIQTTVIGATTTVSKNKVYNLSTTTNTAGVTTGISVPTSTGQAATTAYNCSNNIVGDLAAPSASGTNQVIGIGVAGNASTNAFNLYYNTVYLNAAGGTNFGSSAVSASSTSTTTLRNNALVNLSTASGTGKTVVYRRSTTTLTTYGSASNNNDLYAGTPGANNLIFSDGTNSDQTIAAYKTRVATRDSASFSENPPFLSTTGSNANFLRIDPTVATLLESHAANISGITDDFDGNTRQGNPGYSGSGTAPDVGADEFDGTPASTNANLSNLVLSAGSLSPAFASATTSYTASVSNATASITVTPTVSDAGATVTVNGVAVSSGSPSGSISLNVGTNTITTIVTAQDTSTTKTYTVTVTRRASQTITRNTFGASASKTYGAAAYNLDATATSGLTVTYASSNTDVATISDNTVTIVGAGATTLTASQAGNSSFDPAPDVTQALTVNQKGLTVTGITGDNKVYDGGLTATFSGTATLSGVINSDEVSLSGTPSASFADKNVGTGKTITVSGYTLSGTKAGNYSLTQPSLTGDITARPVTVTADAKVKAKGANDPAFTYTTNSGGLVSGETLSGTLSRDAGATPGTYAIRQGTVTNANNPNYTITYNGANLIITGPIAAADAVTRQPGSTSFKIPKTTLLSNDYRIASNGSQATDNLSITAVTAGTGNTVSMSGGFVLYQPSDPNASDPLTFTYTLSDGSVTDTGTVTVSTSAPVAFTLQILDKTDAVYNGSSTSITVEFSGVPNQSYTIQYSTDMTNWVNYASNPVNTGSAGTFAVTFTASGDQTAAWNTMFFRATR